MQSLIPGILIKCFWAIWEGLHDQEHDMFFLMVPVELTQAGMLRGTEPDWKAIILLRMLEEKAKGQKKDNSEGTCLRAWASAELQI